MSKSKIIIMMHIAKTAGSFVNKIFENELGKDKVLNHLERSLGNHQQFLDHLDNDIKYFSGHIYYPKWELILRLADKQNDAFLVTTLREPFSHVVSHIKWLDHYNLPELKLERGRLPERIQDVVTEIGKCNISDPGELDDLLTNLTDAGIQFLDNCQSRYFICDENSKIKSNTPITLSSGGCIIRALNNFSVILKSDDLDSGFIQINNELDLNLINTNKKINTAQSKRYIDSNNPLIRSVLAKRVTVDLWLWNFVKNNR